MRSAENSSDYHLLQLAEMGVRIPNVMFIRSKAGISVYRVESEGKRYILKVFEKLEDRREIGNYRILASLGIPTLPMLKHTYCALLLPDLENDTKLRLGCAGDLSDVHIAKAIARWYRSLHEKGRAYASEHGSGLYDETDAITLPNMKLIAGKTDTWDNKVWRVIEERFTDIRRLIDALPRTLTYNDFYWTNLVVAKDQSYAMMLDFNLLGKGYAFGDLRNVASSLGGEAKEMFLQEYGLEVINEAEMTADAVLSTLVTLTIACKREVFPEWASSALEELKNGVLFKNLCRWLY